MKFGDSRLNRGRIILLVAGRSRSTHFCAVFNCTLQPTGSSLPCHIRQVYEADCFYKCVQFRDLRTVLEKFDSKPSKAAFSTVFRTSIILHENAQLLAEPRVLTVS